MKYNKWTSKDEKILIRNVNSAVQRGFALQRGFENTSEQLKRSSSACRVHWYLMDKVNKEVVQVAQVVKEVKSDIEKDVANKVKLKKKATEKILNGLERLETMIEKNHLDVRRDLRVITDKGEMLNNINNELLKRSQQNLLPEEPSQTNVFTRGKYGELQPLALKEEKVYNEDAINDLLEENEKLVAELQSKDEMIRELSNDNERLSDTSDNLKMQLMEYENRGFFKRLVGM